MTSCLQWGWQTLGAKPLTFPILPWLLPHQSTVALRNSSPNRGAAGKETCLPSPLTPRRPCYLDPGFHDLSSIWIWASHFYSSLVTFLPHSWSYSSSRLPDREWTNYSPWTSISSRMCPRPIRFSLFPILGPDFYSLWAGFWFHAVGSCLPF